MEKLFMFTNNEKKRQICNISKNSSINNNSKREKVRKTDTNCFANDKMDCEDYSMKNIQDYLIAAFQEVNLNIGITNSCFKKMYRIFHEKKDYRALQYFLQHKENHIAPENLFPHCKTLTKFSECYQKSFPFIGSQLNKFANPLNKSQIDQFLFHKIYQLFNQSYLLPIYSEFMLSLYNFLESQESKYPIDFIRKETNFTIFPQYLIYNHPLISQTINIPLHINTQLSLISSDYPSHILSSIFNMVPSCNKCLLPGFHPKTAWLIPPTYFEKGRLRQSPGFLNGMPPSLLNTCFFVKNMLTVESTYLLVSSSKKEYDYYKKEQFLLKEENCKESIFYFNDFRENNGTEICGALNIRQFNNESYNRNINYSNQNSIFCGFVNIESGNDKHWSNGFNNKGNKSNIECKINSKNTGICSNKDLSIDVIHINEKTFPNVFSDCDIFFRNNFHCLTQWNKNIQTNKFEDKIPLLIPRIKCLIKETNAPYPNFTIIKPCYLLLWSYNIRNCNNTTKDINWINIQCKFAKLKYFGQAYETSVSINLIPHKEVILDQLNRIRNVEEARIFAWILAGCMQYTINELLMDSYTKSLFYCNKNSELANGINCFSNCIKSGTFDGFPDSPLDSNGKIKWSLLRELVES